MTDPYEKLLERAQSNLPKKIHSKNRFEIPKVISRVEGNKTIIPNFIQLANTLHREPKHILKYLQRELATPGNVDNQRLILGRKIGSFLINEKIVKYVKEFVLCPDCNRPDTKIMKKGRILLLKCTACGAKHSIKSKI
jgi:translation initiation factor 2 subunit 2